MSLDHCSGPSSTTGNEMDVRICFIGDSFVNGTGDETTLGWAGRLCAAAVGGVSVTCYNLGVRRDTSADILRRWEAECPHRLPACCDGRVVVSCGVNDTAMEDGRTRVDFDDSCANIRAILDDGVYPSILVGPPPVADDAHNARIRRLSDAFSDIAASLGVGYVALFGRLLDDTVYMSECAAYDGAHPRSAGYERIAALIRSDPDWWFPPAPEAVPPRRAGPRPVG